MVCRDQSCLGKYDFEHIISFARKRFIEGCSTIELMGQANSEREKQEIALVSLLDLEEDTVRELNLSCSYDNECKATDCREMLKKLIEEELVKKARGNAESVITTLQ